MIDYNLRYLPMLQGNLTGFFYANNNQRLSTGSKLSHWQCPCENRPC